MYPVSEAAIAKKTRNYGARGGVYFMPAGPPRPLIVHARKYRPASVYILSDYGKYSKLYKCTTFRKTADISYFTANKQVREGKGPGKTQKICPLDCPWWIWARETKTEKKDGGLGHISSLSDRLNPLVSS